MNKLQAEYTPEQKAEVHKQDMLIGSWIQKQERLKLDYMDQQRIQNSIEHRIRDVANNRRYMAPFFAGIKGTDKPLDGGSLFQKAYWCGCCGKPEVTSWNEETNKKLIERNMCFHCSFFEDIVQVVEQNKHAKVIVNGMIYQPAIDNGGPSMFKGFGGSKFRFKFLDGEDWFVCTNMWSNGDVPVEFLSRLPDNAVMADWNQDVGECKAWGKGN